MNLLEIEDREVQAVEIKGGQVFVRSLTAGEQIDLERLQGEAGDDVRKILAAQLAAYVCDKDGAPALTASQAAEAVEKRKPMSLKQIVQAALSLNRWDEKAKEKTKGNS